MAKITSWPCFSAGKKGRGRCRHHVDNCREIIGCGFGRRDESCNRIRRSGKYQQAAHDRIDRVQLKLEARCNAKVAAAASNRPEEIGMMLSVDETALSISSDYFSSQQRIDREAVLADKIADTTAKRNAPNSD